MDASDVMVCAQKSRNMTAARLIARKEEVMKAKLQIDSCLSPASSAIYWDLVEKTLGLSRIKMDFDEFNERAMRIFDSDTAHLHQEFLIAILGFDKTSKSVKCTPRKKSVCAKRIKLSSSTQTEDITEEKIEDVTEEKLEDVTEEKLEDVTEEKLENITEEKLENITEEKLEDVTEKKLEAATKEKHPPYTPSRRAERPLFLDSFLPGYPPPVKNDPQDELESFLKKHNIQMKPRTMKLKIEWLDVTKLQGLNKSISLTQQSQVMKGNDSETEKLPKPKVYLRFNQTYLAILATMIGSSMIGWGFEEMDVNELWQLEQLKSDYKYPQTISPGDKTFMEILVGEFQPRFWKYASHEVREKPKPITNSENQKPVLKKNKAVDPTSVKGQVTNCVLEYGLRQTSSSVADLINLAAQDLLKTIIKAMLYTRCTRNTSTRHYTMSAPRETIHMSAAERFKNFKQKSPPQWKNLSSLWHAEKNIKSRSRFTMAVMEDQNEKIYRPPKLSRWDLFYALEAHSDVIPNHSIRSVFIGKLAQKLHHPTSKEMNHIATYKETIARMKQIQKQKNAEGKLSAIAKWQIS